MSRITLVTVALALVVVPQAIAEILAGPESYNGHTYYIVSEQNWWDAEAEAISLGGHLVAINDADEQAFVGTFAAGYPPFWIGLNDLAQEGVWVWTNGDEFTYENWYWGEPNNWADSEHCCVGRWASQEKWNDAVCTWIFAGVVEVHLPVDVQLAELVGSVIALNLQEGIDNSLDAKLDSALDALQDANANNDAAAINKLQSFINEVNAQRGKKISEADADELVAVAQAIINQLSAS